MLLSWIAMFNYEFRNRPSPPSVRSPLKSTFRVLTSTASMPSQLRHVSSSTKSKPSYVRLDSTGNICDDWFDSNSTIDIETNPKTFMKSFTLSDLCSYPNNNMDFNRKHLFNNKSKVSNSECKKFTTQEVWYTPNSAMKPTVVQASGIFHAQSFKLDAFPAEHKKNNSIDISGLYNNFSHTANANSINSSCTQCQRKENTFKKEHKMLGEASHESHSFKLKLCVQSPKDRSELDNTSNPSQTYTVNNNLHKGTFMPCQSKEENNRMEEKKIGEFSSEAHSFKLKLHVQSPKDKSELEKTSSPKISSEEIPNIDMELTVLPFETPLMTRPNRRRKCRPSAKKRRRTQQKRNQGKISQCAGDNLILDKDRDGSILLENSIHKESELPSNSILSHDSSPSFQITFVDFSSSSSEARSSSPHEKHNSQFSFLLTTSDTDSSVSNDSEDYDEENEKDLDDSLWESLASQSLCNPFSFSVTYVSHDNTESSQDNEYSDPDDMALISKDVKEANEKWKQAYNKYHEPVHERKVYFPSKVDDLQEVHHMYAWSYAYQAARKGPWEEMARDHERFQKRIADVENSIRHIFQNEHRTNVYAKYFM